MAKRRRRRATRARPADDPDPARTRTPRRHLDLMDCPNHNMDFDLRVPPGVPHNKTDVLVYPLMRLMRAEGNSSTAAGLAFVDDMYGCRTWLDRDTHAPPTWMDPEVFIRMVVDDDEIARICAGYIKNGNDGNRSALRKRIGEIYEQQYLVYMIEKFDEVEDLVARWTVGHFAVSASDEAVESQQSKKVPTITRKPVKKKRKVRLG